MSRVSMGKHYLSILDKMLEGSKVRCLKAGLSLKDPFIAGYISAIGDMMDIIEAETKTKEGVPHVEGISKL